MLQDKYMQALTSFSLNFLLSHQWDQERMRVLRRPYYRDAMSTPWFD